VKDILFIQIILWFFSYFSFKTPGLNTFNIFKLSKRFNILKEILMHLLFFTLNILILSLIPTGDNDIEVTFARGNSTRHDLNVARSQSNNTNVLGWITVALYISFKLTNELQKVYMLYGLVRSPLYSMLSR